MKKRLVLILAAVILLATFSVALAAEDGTENGVTVYISVSVDGKLEVAAQPVTVAEATVDGALRAAHEAYYSGGADGYAAGIDSMYNMFLISRAWGVDATPYVMLNGEPLGADPMKPATANTAPVANGDSIIMSTSSNAMVPAPVVSMTASLADGEATVTALAWTLDFMSFTYSSTPFAGATVIDPATGGVLGTTDEAGMLTFIPPESGIAAIDGLSAVRVDGAATSVPDGDHAEPGVTELPKLDIGDEPLMDPALIRFVIVGIIILIPIAAAVIRNAGKHVRKDKEAGISQR